MHTIFGILWRSGIGATVYVVALISIAAMVGTIRVQLLWVWRDLWVGVYVAKEGPVYICLVPTVVVKITPTRLLP